VGVMGGVVFCGNIGLGKVVNAYLKMAIRTVRRAMSEENRSNKRDRVSICSLPRCG